MIERPEIWICEFSPIQNAFHVDTLSRILALNRKTAAEGKTPGFVILALAASAGEANAFCEKWRREYLREGANE